MAADAAELSRALASSTKATRARSQARATKAAKRETAKARRDDVREQATARAKDECEACGVSLFAIHHPAQLDHFFGRSRAESVETCWLICARCHREKTLNYPDAAAWFEAFIRHCVRHGYRAAAERARARLEGIIAIRRSNTTQEGEANG